MAGTYTAANVALAVVPDLSGTFAEIDRKFGTYKPKPITPQIKPEVDDKAADELGPKGRFGAKALVAGAAVGAAIGAVVSQALSSALDVAEAQGKLQAQLGGNNPQWAREMGAIAGKLYASGYGENLESVNSALRSVIQSGAVMEDASNEQVSSVTSGVLNLAKAFGVDTAEAARAVGTVMRNGLAPDANTALDVITRGFQQGVDIGGDFLDTLNEYSGQFSKFGIDAQTATGLLSQGLQAGARDSDFVADALKEFSIRAVDGSKSTAQGFQALGLSADDMARKFGAGGQEAAGALDLTLDKLREMPDPVQRSQAAVALFGTKAEDLGAALFALDPSTAAQGLGELGGAAEGMGEALATPASRIEGLKRSFEMGLVDLIGGKLLPLFDQVMGWGQKLFGPAWEPVKAFLGFLTGTGGVVVAVIGAIAVAMWAWTTASAALNLTLLANPITWVIAAIVALVGFVIYAYNNFEWFRNAVSAVWDFLKGLASWIAGVFVAVWDGLVAAVQWVGSVFTWLWQNVLGPVFGFIGDAALFLAQLIIALVVGPIVLAWQALGAAISSVWTNVLKPAWDAVAAAGLWLWNNVLGPVFGWIGAGWQLLIAGIEWYWLNLLRPVWDAVQAAALWLWNNVLSPVFGWIRAGWQALGDGMRWIYDNIIRPIFDFFAGVVQGFKDTFDRLVGGIKAIWDGLIEGLKRPIRIVVDAVWNNGIGRLWDAAKTILPLGNFPRASLDGFAEGGRIRGSSPHGRADDKLIRATSGEWIMPVDSVDYYGPGLMAAIQKRRLSREAAANLPAYATGGPVGWRDLWDTIKGVFPGATLNSAVRKGDPGEHGAGLAVDLGGPMLAIDRWIAGNYPDSHELIHTAPGAINLFNGRAHAYNAATQAEHRNHVHWARREKGRGGVLGLLFDHPELIAATSRVAIQSMINEIMNPVRDAVNRDWPGTALSQRIPREFVTWGIDKVGGLLLSKADEVDAGAQGGVAAGVEQWRPTVLQALGLLGLSPGLADTTLRRMNKESGGNARAINNWDSNAKKGTPSKGLMQVIDPTFRSNWDPRTPNDIWNPLSNIVASMRYALARYGSLPAAYDRPGGYDSGGWLPPGYTMAYNGTGKPEAILTHDQWQLLSASIQGGDQGGDTYVINPSAPLDEVALARETARIRAFNRRVAV